MSDEKILSKIVKGVKKLKGFVDVVDRSGEEFIHDWSDVDISLIFKKIDYELLLKLKNCFKKWEKLGRKIDLFLLTLEDNPKSPFHFHGGYQLSYLKELEKSKSQFKKYPLENPYHYTPFLLAIDCYRTMALKIQEIRRTILTGRIRFYSRSLSPKARETMHVLKKAKTIFKMASEIASYIGEKPPKEIEKFINFYERCRRKWTLLKRNNKLLSWIERKTINEAEKIFQKVSKKYLPNLLSKNLKTVNTKN